MSLVVAQQNLENIFIGDSSLRALLSPKGKQLSPVHGNFEIRVYPPEKLPAVAFEFDDGQAAIESIGGGIQLLVAPLLVSFVWSEQDRETAFTQRKSLPGIVAKLLMNNSTLGVAGAGAYLRDFQPDRAANHPLHIWRCGIHFEYQERN